MSSSALDSQGMVLQSGSSASPIVWTTVPEIQEISGPGGSANEIDVTDLSSTGKEFRIGLKDEGNVSLTLFYIPNNAVHEALLVLRDNQTLSNFQLIFTDSPQSTWRFTAYVIGFEISNGVDAALTSTMTLRVSGAVTRT